MYRAVWLARRDPFRSRQAFAAASATHGVAASSIDSLGAWEVDYLVWLFRDALWYWVDDASKIAPLKPDVVVFMSNSFALDGVLDAWTPKVFVHLSDEWGRTPMLHQRTEKIPLVLRQYRFDHYYWPKNVRHIPLGFMACMFDNLHAIAAPASIAERPYKWSFVGSIRGDRIQALATFDSWTPHWKMNCPPREMARVYGQSVFVLCPRGKVVMDCFRNYEATLCGAIPVVAGCTEAEYVETFCDIGRSTVGFLRDVGRSADAMPATLREWCGGGTAGKEPSVVGKRDSLNPSGYRGRAAVLNAAPGLISW